MEIKKQLITTFYVQLTNFTVAFVGTAECFGIGPTSGKSSGEIPRVSLHASSNSFCILAFRFLQQQKIKPMI